MEPRAPADTREPLVTVVVPWRVAESRADGPDPVLASVQSVLDQGEALIEILVVSDAPIEPSGAAPSLPDGVRVVAHPLPGATSFELLNRGLDLARGELIGFLPAGDRLAPGCLARALELLEGRSDLVAVFCGAEPIDACGSPVDAGDELEALPSSRDALLAELVERNPLALGGALLRRSIVRDLGGFDWTFTESADHDLWLRLVPAREVALITDRLVRLRSPRLPRQNPTIASAEHARAVIRAFGRFGVDLWVRALGGGPRSDHARQRIARADLARRLVRTGLGPLRPFVHRLVHESRAAGADFPADSPFEELRRWLPELARSEGWFDSGLPVTDDVDLRPSLRAPAASEFPPRLRVALAALSPHDLRDVSHRIERAAELWAQGLEPVVFYLGRIGGEQAPLAAGPWRVEILRHDGSPIEIRAALERLGIALLISTSGHPAAAVASGMGIPVVEPWASEEGSRPRADELLRLACAAAAVRAREAAERARRGREERALHGAEGRALAAMARALARAERNAPGPTAPDATIVARLDEAGRRVAALAHLTRQAEGTARLILDKLRITHRVKEALRARKGAAPSSATGAVRELDMRSVHEFLGRISRQSGANLWVVYTTDPFSKDRGQRSTWIARELARRGHHLVFFYWRWHLEEEIAPSPDANVLSVPIDQYYRLEAPLMELSGEGLAKRFLIEFPDRFLFQQIDLANAHGFVTVYDCVDDWEEFARLGKAHWYDPGVERHLARHANVLVATHPRLVERLSDLSGRDAALIPNGVDLASLLGNRERAAERGSGAVIGYFGHLTDAWFDWDLVVATASQRPEWRFELIGDGAPAGLALPANVSLIGPVPHHELAARSRSWRVGIVPFRPGRLTQAVDPVKLYEYLALGLTVVAVDMPHFEGVPGVHVSRREEFVCAIEAALGALPDRAGMDSFVSESRWERRVDALLSTVQRFTPEQDLWKSL